MALTAKKVYAILKRQISDMEAKLNSPVRYRGTVATADLLPLNPDIGDMYNIESKSVYGEAGMNVAWNGVVWDTMGAPIDMSLYFTKEEAETVIQRLVTEYFEKNPVKPGATTEQAQQIEQNKTDITSLKTDLSTKITKFYASSQGETHLADSDNGKIMDMMIYGKSSQDGTPTPENPVEIKSVVNPTVKIVGKNLVQPLMPTTTVDGVTVTNNGDGTYTLNGTATGNATFRLDQLSYAGTGNLNKYKGTYTLSRSDTSYEARVMQHDTWKLASFLSIGSKKDTKEINLDNCFIFISVSKGKTYNNVLVDLQFEVGSTATSYEPYHEQTVTLPYTLNAIPVESGGNVTINGQQYIADYVDVERGKLVRHIKEKSDTISIAVAGSVGGLGHYDYDIPFIKNVICNITNIVYEDINQGWASKQACISGSIAGELRVYLPAGNHNVKIIYELETPEEIDLTKEEIVAFKALTTYYPTTNISINSEQLDGYTVFNYPISMQNGWNYVKQQIGDTRDYIYDMDARTQDTDLQAAEAYVNSEYAVALTELEV